MKQNKKTDISDRTFRTGQIGHQNATVKPQPEELYNYYVSEKFRPILPSDAKFRHFRFKMADGSWKKVYDRIRTPEDIIKWTVKLGGCDLYYSTSQWLQPHKISRKGGSGTYHVADNTLLRTDLVFDIDAPEPITMESLDLARKSANNIYECMKDYKELFELEYFAFTGFKGWRLSYKEINPNFPEDPRKRFEYIEQKRKVFIDELLGKLKDSPHRLQNYKVQPFFDVPVTMNVMCVVRLLGSVHSTTGYISTKLPINLIKKTTKEILTHVPYIGKMRPVIPIREMIKQDKKLLPRPRLLTLAEDVSGLASLPSKSKSKYFITNRVLGIKKGFIPIFLYQGNKKNYQSQLLKLQKEYHLGTIYLYQHENNKVAISLKIMQKRQLQKVLNRSSSKVKYDFMKYQRILAPLVMQQTGKLEANTNGTLSAGHLHFVEPLKSEEIIHTATYIGWERIEFVMATKRLT